MNISTIGVTKANMMEVITDPSMYVIKKSYLHDGYRMIPVKDADVKDLLSDECIIVKITE